MKKNGILTSTFAAAILLLSSCNSDYTYSDYSCNLVIDNGVHNNAVLASAMNSASPGVFCTITPTVSSGATYYSFTTNLGDSDRSIFNAEDKQRNNYNRIGMNYGLIVGFGNLSSPATFYAYDAECPNCFNKDALPVRSYKLTVSSSGIATCANCKCTYNLNTGGNIVTGDGGSPLTRYRAQTSGPFGVLYVH